MTFLKYIKITLLLSSLFFLKENSFAISDDHLKISVDKTFKALYNFEFQKADSLIQKIKSNYNSHPITHLLVTSYYWWLIVSGEDNPDNRKNYEKGIDNALSILNTKDKNQLSNEDIGNYINVYAYIARMELFNKELISGFVHLNNCIGYLKKSFEKENEYEMFYLTSGLYNYFVAHSSKEYPYLLPYLAFHPKGNREKGTLQLFTAYKSKDALIKTEATYFLMKIFYEREKDYAKAEMFAEKLTDKYPDNLIYQYYYYTILFARDKKEEAILQITKLNASAASNTQLSRSQKNYFIEMTQEDIKNYLLKHTKEN